MKTLKEYANLINENINSPGLLADIGTEASADYAYYSQELIEIKMRKPEIWIEIKTKDNKGEPREKYLSDKLTEQFWRMQKIGKKEIELKQKCKALEKIISSIKTGSFIKTKEAESIM